MLTDLLVGFVHFSDGESFGDSGIGGMVVIFIGCHLDLMGEIFCGGLGLTVCLG